MPALCGIVNAAERAGHGKYGEILF